MARIPTREIVLAGLFAALTAAGAHLKIPLEPVPFTLQPLVVLLGGAVLRPRAAALAQGAYLASGLLGLPVFARGGGPAYVLQPTFGFLVGFAVAAWTVSMIVHAGRGRGAAKIGVAVAAGLAVLYACGVLGLWLNLAVFQDKAAVFPKVVWGLGGYLALDVVKAGLAVALAPAVRRALASARTDGTATRLVR